ncbi:hypothetical protein K9B33_19595 [Sphingobium sp. 3R8]|uniref:hypothetical protein n=1 Tax=Sphingobium sp. 3R8 TaxID=2874921 RepID=UPI001CCC2C1C|nr:hypothetical protein [Sphingobium sp. 3R8]MBZ9649746.1 hypothetical protein [Sphingobium sp. 3R8]
MVAQEFEIVKRFDGRIFVVLHTACTIDQSKILELLRDAGADLSVVVFIKPEDVQDTSYLDGSSVIIPLDEATCALPELEVAARQCNQSGGDIVVVFGEGFPYSDLHPIAEKYGTQCGWSADLLRIRIAGGGGDDPRDASGVPVDRPEAGQVKC